MRALPADAAGSSQFRVFVLGAALSIVMVLIYTHLPPISLPLLIVINALVFLGIFSRMIPFQALVSSVPEGTQRGSFNAINASVQQLSGGLASVIAGHIVTLGADGKLRHFDEIGYLVVATSLAALTLLWRYSEVPAIDQHLSPHPPFKRPLSRLPKQSFEMAYVLFQRVPLNGHVNQCRKEPGMVTFKTPFQLICSQMHPWGQGFVCAARHLQRPGVALLASHSEAAGYPLRLLGGLSWGCRR